MSPWRSRDRVTTVPGILATAQKRRDPMRHTAAKSEIASATPLIVEAWRCIGCGRIEAPQPCIGVCEDRKVRLVDAADHEAALMLLREAEERAAALEGLVRRLAQTRPRAGDWEQSYKALQKEAQRALTATSLARSVSAAAVNPSDAEQPKP